MATSSSNNSPPSDAVEVRVFAAAATLARASVVAIPRPSTVADLRRSLISSCPALAPIADGLLVAVDGRYAADEATLSGEEELAAFPPVSGG